MVAAMVDDPELMFSKSESHYFGTKFVGYMPHGWASHWSRGNFSFVFEARSASHLGAALARFGIRPEPSAGIGIMIDIIRHQ